METNKQKNNGLPTEQKNKPALSVLQKAGLAAIARHGFSEVFVTSDGQAFHLANDAKKHADSLKNKEITKVTNQTSDK